MKQIQSADRLALVREACAKFPNHGNHTIAKALYRKHPQWFPSYNAARCSVRAVRGAMGQANRNTSTTKHLHRSTSPFVPMPPSQARPRPVEKLPPGKWLVISDVHIPHHDCDAVEAALSLGEQHKTNGVLINGDWLDFFAISRFITNPHERDLVGELAASKAMFAHVRSRFPKAKIVFKKGNHEERWAHYIWQKAPEMWGVPEMDFAAITGAAEVGATIIEGRTMIQAGKLGIVHGHEIEQGASSPVNPARGLFLRTLDSYLMGHRHRTSEHTEKTANGRFITCWSVGCLAGLWPEYATINKFNHGVCILEVAASGQFSIHNERILDGKVL